MTAREQELLAALIEVTDWANKFGNGLIWRFKDQAVAKRAYAAIDSPNLPPEAPTAPPPAKPHTD